MEVENENSINGLLVIFVSWLYLSSAFGFYHALKSHRRTFLATQDVIPTRILNSTKIGAGDKLQPFIDKAGTYIYLVS